VVNINRLVFVRDSVFNARQYVSENCLLYMEHHIVLHTEHTENCLLYMAHHIVLHTEHTENCLLYMEHHIVLHTEYTEKRGQSITTVLDGILLYNLLQHVLTPLKPHLQAI
jgi:hypothetical protein